MALIATAVAMAMVVGGITAGNHISENHTMKQSGVFEQVTTEDSDNTVNCFTFSTRKHVQNRRLIKVLNFEH